MRTRTLLTSPPGRTPEPELGRSRVSGERYAPALGLPSEVVVPSRFRRLVVGFVAITAVAVLAVGIVRVSAARQYQDPALTELGEP